MAQRASITSSEPRQSVVQRVLATSTARVAPGGDTGRWQWLLPALVVVVVIFAALNVRWAQDASRHASAAQVKADAAAAAVTDATTAGTSALHALSPAPGVRLRVARSFRGATAAIAQVADAAPGETSVVLLDSTTRRSAQAVDDALAHRDAAARRQTTGELRQLTEQAGTMQEDLAASAHSAEARERARLTATLIGGLLLVCLLLWSFWAKRTRLAVEQSERRFRSLIERSTELVAIVDRRHHIRLVTPAFERKLGYDPAVLVGRELADLVHPEDRERVDLDDPTASDAKPHWRLRRSDDTWHETQADWIDLRDDPAVAGFVVTMHDVGDQMELRDRVRWQAFHDSLTGLPNRALFEDRVSHTLERARRTDGRAAALFIDLDDFKTVNDSLGHAQGDELLREFALRLGECIRRADTAARFGGDEFAVLVDTTADEDVVAAANTVAHRVHEALERPFRLGPDELFLHASVGIAIGTPAMLAEELIRNADIAMYAAKGAGKKRTAVFEPSMHAAARKRFQLSGDLRRAVAERALTVKYQPLVRLNDGRMLGAEALVRWPHPTLGEIQPIDFIGLAEETGLIVPIGRFVLEEACLQLAEWLRVEPERRPDYVSVNLSARQFQPEGQIVEDVRNAARAAAIDPKHLMLEITESVLMIDQDAIVRDLTKLRDMGVRIAIDDFGTGYSALSYLRQFPIDTVKMDRSFVRSIGEGTADQALIRSVVQLGEALNMQIVAEGIEADTQLDSVTALNCDIGQGYLFAPPLDAESMRGMLNGEWSTRAGGPTPPAA